MTTPATIRKRRDLMTFMDRLRADGEYGEDPVAEAFIRGHDEPGRAWNMEEWNRRHVRSHA